MATSPPAPGPGRRAGDYEILVEAIAKGAMGVVHLARQADIERLVALKEFHADTLTDPVAQQRFLLEGTVAAEFNHPNVVSIFDAFQHAGVPFIAMEYVAGGPLRWVMGQLTFEQTVGTLEGLLAGLQEAGRLGIVHRDLKPENLLVTEQGAIKIVDFGIAKAVKESRALTAAGMTVGTPEYMAPEQATDSEIGPWTDLYAVGVIAYELFLGRVPFEGATPTEVLLKQVNEPPVPPVWLRPQLDPRLCVWIERLLAKARQARPRSAEEAWYALEEIAVALAGPRWRRNAPLPYRPPRAELLEQMTRTKPAASR